MKYMNVGHLSEITDTCPRTVLKRIKEMKASGAYPDIVVLTDPIRAEVSAYVHYNTYRQEIKRGLRVPEWREA